LQGGESEGANQQRQAELGASESDQAAQRANDGAANEGS